MEEQLNQLLQSSLEVTIIQNNQTILDKYYELFDEKDYIKRFLANDINEIYNDMEKYYSLNLQYLRYGHNEYEMQEMYKKLVYAIVDTSDEKNKIKLIPLIIYLDSENILYEHLYKIGYFNNFYEIKNYFIGTLKSFQVKLDLSNTPEHHWENNKSKEYKKGIETLNFKKIYDFIDSLERGIGFMYSPYIDFLSFISNKLFFDDFCHILDTKDTLSIMYLTHDFSIEDKLKVADKSTSLLVKFQAIRESVYFKKNNQACLNLLKNERVLIKDIIIEFSKDEVIWNQFLDYYLEYPSRAIQLFFPLGISLDQIEKNKILIFVDKIKIDSYFDNDCKEALNSCFFHIKDDDLQKKLFEYIFKRWIKFIDNYDKYIGNVLLTNVLDITLTYYDKYTTKEEVIREANNIIFKIEEINNVWFRDGSSQDNYLYKQLSKLFIYGFAIKKYDIQNIQTKIKNIIDERKGLRKNAMQNNMSTYELFYTNVLNIN